jgi:hypothetical protein
MFKGGAKEFWFVLTSENLMWFKDEEVSCDWSSPDSVLLSDWPFSSVVFNSIGRFDGLLVCV